ncbi:MAG: TerB family tellurite resistance protein [Bacteroidetes bacterium]|nr:TerB family tellurite resistance protein [Bacteroidota bacterium]
MGLFSTLSAINSSATAITSTAKLVNELATNERVKAALFEVSVKGLKKMGSLFDTDGDGDFDETDLANLVEYAEMISSVLGHAAIADDVINEEEEDKAWDLIQKACFDHGGIFPPKIFDMGKLKKKEIKNQLLAKFNKPSSFKKIVHYAEEKGLDEDFYEMACTIVSADKVIKEAEQEFLSEFADSLGLSKFDVKRINKTCLLI